MVPGSPSRKQSRSRLLWLKAAHVGSARHSSQHAGSVVWPTDRTRRPLRIDPQLSEHGGSSCLACTRTPSGICEVCVCSPCDTSQRGGGDGGRTFDGDKSSVFVAIAKSPAGVAALRAAAQREQCAQAHCAQCSRYEHQGSQVATPGAHSSLRWPAAQASPSTSPDRQARQPAHLHPIHVVGNEFIPVSWSGEWQGVRLDIAGQRWKGVSGSWCVCGVRDVNKLRGMLPPVWEFRTQLTGAVSRVRLARLRVAPCFACCNVHIVAEAMGAHETEETHPEACHRTH